MKLVFLGFFKILLKTFKSWNDKDPFRQSAVIAYYAIFSIPGLLILILSLLGYFIDKQTVSQQIVSEISATMGVETASQIEYMLLKTNGMQTSMIKTIFGVFILLMGATGVFVELQKTLNAIWKVKIKKEKGFIKVLKARLFSFGLILGIVFLLLVSLVFSTLLATLSDQFKSNTTLFSSVAFNLLNTVISLGVVSLLFAMIFKILPDCKIEWNHVWVGSLLTGVLFEMGKSGLAFYFSKSNPASGYGAAGSIVLILLWVSYTSMILFFGAEFTAIYAQKKSGRIKPTEIAVVDLKPRI